MSGWNNRIKLSRATAQPCNAKCISLWPSEDFTVTNISGSKLNVQKLSEWDLQRPIIFLSSKRSPEHRTFRQLVNRVSNQCKCQEYVNKLSEGVYNVFGKRVFIRLLKGKHLMVRVGGGWDTFENYLLHHDPIQVFEFHQGGLPGSSVSVMSSRSSTAGSAHSHSFAVARNDFKPEPPPTDPPKEEEPRDGRVKFKMMWFLRRMRRGPKTAS
ncbi:hypothetical protein RRG08_002842 [Elysia crispata]|uniref:GAR domain-containing protein n=1 Tax=Elysia crispata TaxID=231223 RepID=A0AAE1CM46_9GAST|nr:hypothetical protein RRG08_002842 [Elysia crispata]